MVKPGDASMASPFTAKDTCIMPCTDIIKQVRAVPGFAVHPQGMVVELHIRAGRRSWLLFAALRGNCAV